ncbi:7-deoxyloganetin glucosyltransferase [Camellia lanceoleosa]|uniref:7-deoxyloganetin glucosyltransferase n=1 Tax=Camellia lanceoleosa TaxID=1840588 RepID=A0ACC0HU63_9ERIC|nr:7-deoxyloganetin glucosyltransferase [Camellia lanceoleosa]
MSSMGKLEKPHAVCIPYPAQGHINPMLKLSKLLHQRGFHITFVNTEFNHKRLLKSRGPDSLNGLSSFRFETIPDGLPESDADATQDVPSLCESTRKHCLAPFKDLLSKLNDTASSNVPPVTCIVSDGAMSFTVDAGEELGIPEVLLWTASACGFMGYEQYRNLIDKGYIPLKDKSCMTNGYLDTVIDWIPGMKGIRLKDLPSFLRTTDLSDFMIDFVFGEIERARRASAIIFNTFEKLEHNVLEALSSIFPPIYTIGPLHLLKNQINDDSLKLIGSNLWKEEPECLEWLNTKEPSSVVYVNFGSITVMTPNQMVEFAWGLANSNQTFLWIIRPDLVIWRLGTFFHRNSWKQQKKEAYWQVGAPKSKFLTTRLLEGMEIDNDVKKDEVESLVRELMVGEKGKEMKKKAMEWKRLAQEATESSSGSSFLNLDKVVNQVLLSPRH